MNKQYSGILASVTVKLTNRRSLLAAGERRGCDGHDVRSLAEERIQ